MSFWKKTMDYLGLGPDDAYDDYDDERTQGQSKGSSYSRDPNGWELLGGRHWPAEATKATSDAPLAECPVARLRVAGSPRRPAGPTSLARDRNLGPPAGRAALRRRTGPVRPRNFNQAQEIPTVRKAVVSQRSHRRDVARSIIDSPAACATRSGTMESPHGVYS